MNGFVKLHRRFCSWGWYKDIAVKAVFLDLLLNANYDPSEFMGHTIQRGETVFGYASLAERSGVSIQQARTAIAKLKKTGEISVWSNRHLSVATIVKFDEYQQTINKPSTNNQQTDNKQITSSKNKRNKEVKNVVLHKGTSVSEVGAETNENHRTVEFMKMIGGGGDVC